MQFIFVQYYYLLLFFFFVMFLKDREKQIRKSIAKYFLIFK